MIKATIPFLLLALFACSNSDNYPDPGKEPGPAPGEVVTYGNESLVAVDPAGKEIAFDYRAPRDKKVGIFYFIWLGAHGYDTGDYFGGDIIPPKATDTRSPYDISELEKATAIRPTFLSVPEAPCTIGASPIWITTSPTTRG